MDYIIFDQPGGFPLTTDILTAMQLMYQPYLNGLGAMAGSRAIISGCGKVGTKINAGLIQIDGEMYGLKEGIEQDTITIKEEKKEYEFENGENKVVVTFRYALFGTGTDNYKWADFKRVMALNTLTENFKNKADQTTIEAMEKRLVLLEQMNAPILLEKGLTAFTGTQAEIPKGYAIETITNGRFLVGVDISQNEFNSVKKSAGKKSTPINSNNLPDFSANTDAITFKSDRTNFGIKTGTDTWVHNANFNVNGSTVQELSILPPYVTVYWIKWVGIGKGING